MRNIDNIITESINKLLVEEFGIIYGLEPFCDYIMKKFFDAILHDCLDRNKFEINVSTQFNVQDIKDTVRCKNWYGLDNLNTILLTTSTGNNSEASVNFDDDENLIPEIVINLGSEFRKVQFYTFILKYGKEKAFKKFYSVYKPSIMHELTHLIEIVNTWGSHKYPAYAYMSDPDYEDQVSMMQIKDISFAFSKTEMNARVTTFYYQILNDEFLVNKIKSWNGSKRELCKFLISFTTNFNWINSIKKYLFIVRRAAEKGEKSDIDFVRQFYKLNKIAAFSGSKNLFKIKWSPNENDENAFNWNDEQIRNMAFDLYEKMYDMYYTYIKKLYKVADLAIDAIKNEQTIG